MNIDTIHLVVFSPCGGTEAVGDCIVKELALPVEKHAWTLPEHRARKMEFFGNELAILAFPVYGGRMPVNAKELFENLRGNSTPCALVAVYGNRAYEGALLDMHELALANGFKPVAAVAAVAEHSMAPQVANGRPDRTDEAALSKFGSEIVKLADSKHVITHAPGAMPEWEMPEGTYLFPITDSEKCIACGICSNRCPVGAIDPDKPAHTDIKKCILCSACVKYCPEEARTMGNPETRAKFKPHLQIAAKGRREPELFY